MIIAVHGGLRGEACLVEQAHDVAIHLAGKAVTLALNPHPVIQAKKIPLRFGAVTVELNLVARTDGDVRYCGDERLRAAVQRVFHARGERAVDVHLHRSGGQGLHGQRGAVGHSQALLVEVVGGVGLAGQRLRIVLFAVGGGDGDGFFSSDRPHDYIDVSIGIMPRDGVVFSASADGHACNGAGDIVRARGVLQGEGHDGKLVAQRHQLQRSSRQIAGFVCIVKALQAGQRAVLRCNRYV